MSAHDTCKLEQVGPCVYCADHNVRLYQGQLPKDQRPECSEHVWDTETGLGFYFQCEVCGEMEWPE